MDEPRESDELEEQATETEHPVFERIPEGAGCVEIWERLSECREND